MAKRAGLCYDTLLVPSSYYPRSGKFLVLRFVTVQGFQVVPCWYLWVVHERTLNVMNGITSPVIIAKGALNLTELDGMDMFNDS